MRSSWRLRVIGSMSMKSARLAWFDALAAGEIGQHAPLGAGQADGLGLLVELAAQQARHVVDQKAEVLGGGKCVHGHDI